VFLSHSPTPRFGSQISARQKFRWKCSAHKFSFARADNEQHVAVLGTDLGIDGVGIRPGEVAGAVLMLVVLEVAFDYKTLLRLVVAVRGIACSGLHLHEGGDEARGAVVEQDLVRNASESGVAPHTFARTDRP
jgi:hypothetical protein